MTSFPKTFGPVRRFGPVLAALLLWCAVLVGHSPALAESGGGVRLPADAPQVTGPNVQLPQLPRGFETSNSDWIQLSYPSDLAHWVEPLLDEARLFRAELRRDLGQPVLTRVRVRIADDPAQMATLAPEGAPYPKYAVGVAYSRLGLILLTRDGLTPNSEHDMREVLRHELAHVALYDAIGGRHVPLWFNEGLAVTLSREHGFARTRALWVATVAGSLIPFSDLEGRFPRDLVGVPLAYAQSADLMRYLTRQRDAERFRLLITRLKRGQPFEHALSDAYGVDTYNLERAWLDDVEERYSFWPIVFSGTFVWTGAVVLAVVAWRRKRRRHQDTLARWAREEAIEDAQRVRKMRQALQLLPWVVPTEPVEAAPQVPPPQRPPRDSRIPKVEHEGDWHTLH